MQKIDLDKFVKDKTLGYFYVYLPNHELANGSGKVYMHRYIVSLKLGRLILQNEHVHHIDGNRANNEPENLEVLSASAHLSQHMRERHPPEQVNCARCGFAFACSRTRLSKSKNGKLFCTIKCAILYNTKVDIDRDTLLDLVWTFPTTKVAEILGVSDSAIGKRCKKLKIPKPLRGYWAKIAAGKDADDHLSSTKGGF